MHYEEKNNRIKLLQTSSNMGSSVCLSQLMEGLPQEAKVTGHHDHQGCPKHRIRGSCPCQRRTDKQTQTKSKHGKWSRYIKQKRGTLKWRDRESLVAFLRDRQQDNLYWARSLCECPACQTSEWSPYPLPGYSAWPESWLAIAHQVSKVVMSVPCQLSPSICKLFTQSRPFWFENYVTS